ncbi:hypothetical protein WJX74_006166 [Apatococcus lobatus]|uniref:Uncharacterized protein n=1 Tax=Apatococcus lobatus TaxID=904363 RepID=A0AAW1QYT9_9CHLO
MLDICLRQSGRCYQQLVDLKSILGLHASCCAEAKPNPGSLGLDRSSPLLECCLLPFTGSELFPAVASADKVAWSQPTLAGAGCQITSAHQPRSEL